MMNGLAILLLLLQASGGGGGGGGGGRPAATPAGDPAAWFTTDDYPPEALRKNDEGRVSFFVNVDASGAPTACYILTSSGSSALDNGTCAAVMKKSHFKPAHDSVGKAVASTWSSSVRWRIPEPAAIDLSKGPVQQFSATIEVSLDSEGTVTGCKAVSVVGGPSPCADFPVGRQSRAPTVKDGKPVASVMTETVNVSIRAAN